MSKDSSAKFSFEFFPPKTDEQRATLEATVPKLKSLKPEYASVTFGAGGSTLSYTPETVRRLRQHHGLETATLSHSPAETAFAKPAVRIH